MLKIFLFLISDSGLSANVAVVTAYLMTVYSLDYYSAIGALRSLRLGAHPVEPLQKQLIEFDSETNEKLVNKQNHTNNTHREQQQQQTELLDSSKHPLNSIMYLTITSASERERLNSIYGEWPYLEVCFLFFFLLLYYIIIDHFYQVYLPVNLSRFLQDK